MLNFHPADGSGAETATKKWGGGGGGGGGANSTIARCRRQCTEARSADQSARSAENFSPSFFSYQDGLSWHLRALY